MEENGFCDGTMVSVCSYDVLLMLIIKTTRIDVFSSCFIIVCLKLKCDFTTKCSTLQSYTHEFPLLKIKKTTVANFIAFLINHNRRIELYRRGTLLKLTNLIN